MKAHVWLIGALAVLLVASTETRAQQMLKREPAMGAMKEGDTVFVDDGKCPKGQVRKVVGGNHIEVGGSKKVRRSSSCVARP